MLELEAEFDYSMTLKVVGVGGAGGNALDALVDEGLPGVDLIAVNTDAQALERCRAPQKVQIGSNLTRGRGAGANAEVGRRAAEENREDIAHALAGADLVFIAAGLGGGTGTGASPVVAEVARERGALVVAVVTTPFDFEGRRRYAIAEHGLRELRDKVDTLITVPNQKLFGSVDRNIGIAEAFRKANSVLLQGISGITNMVTKTGLINRDFADVRAVLSGAGTAVLGVGCAEGEDRVAVAAAAALSCPFLEEGQIKGAQNVLLNIESGTDPELTLGEIEELMRTITEATDGSANIVFGTALDESLGGKVRLTIIASGLQSREPGTQLEMEDAARSDSGRALITDIVQGFEEELDIPTFIRRFRGEQAAAR